MKPEHCKTSIDFQSSEKYQPTKVFHKKITLSLTVYCMIAPAVELMTLPCILQSDHQVCH